jgi:hypothetical protein
MSELEQHLQGRQQMSFTRQLFDLTAMALPNITARTFSRYCGKSEGYYGSISAQNLDISTNSLLYLSEVLEHKRATSPNRYITELQDMIAKEVARRMNTLATENLAVRKMIIRAVAHAYVQRTDEYSAPPIVIA